MQAGRHLVILGCCLLGACTAENGRGLPGGVRGVEELHPVTLPDLSRAERRVRDRVSSAHQSLLARLETSDVTGVDLAAAFGNVGLLILAADYPQTAEPYLRNAQLLAPDDFRWPYYLGQLYRFLGQPGPAVAALEEAHRLSPDYEAAAVWLGHLHLDGGRLDAAGAALQRVGASSDSVSARYLLGRLALARRDYAAAIQQLETVLREQPAAGAARYPLAMAYRGLGDRARAAQHLARRTNDPLRPDDPLMQQLGSLLDSAQIRNNRGLRAVDARRWAEAVEQFRRGVELAPDDPMIRLNLGSALSRIGAVEAALAEYDRALAIDPRYARAHYARARLEEQRGRDREAIEGYRRAVVEDADNVDAQVALADALRQAGELDAAVTHYRRALALRPGLFLARLGHGLSLVGLSRYPEAREVFVEAMTLHPEQPVFAHALARVLAAAPDDRVRHGTRALQLVEWLWGRDRSPDLLETRAMALAELGRYDEALTWQRRALTTATGAGQTATALRMSELLSLYRQGRPSRVPWPPDHPVWRRRDLGPGLFESALSP